MEKIERGNTRVALKAGVWYIVSTFLIRAMAFLTTPIFTRIMSEEAYGEFTNFASWRSIFLIITGFELYSTLSRGFYDFEEDYDKYTSSVTLLCCLTTLFWYALFLLAGDVVYRFVAIPPAFVHIMFLSLLFVSCKSVFLAKERTLYKYKSVVLISAIEFVIPTLIAVLLVLLAPETDKLAARVYGFYIPAALLGAVCLAILVFKGKSFRFSHCSYALKLAFPLMLQYLTVYLLTNTNIIITKNALGAAAAAIVSIMTSVIHIMTLLFQSVNGAVTTWVMDNIKAGKRKLVRNGGLVYVLFLTALAVGVILFTPEIVWIMGGDKYKDSVALIPGMAVSVLLQAVATLFTVFLTYEKKVGKLAVYTGIVAVLAIVGKVLLLPECGMISLPYVNIAAFAVLFVIQYILVRKAGYKDVIHLKAYLALIFGTFALALISPVLYQLRIVRYALIIMLCIGAAAVLYRKRDMVMKLLKRKKA